MIRIPENITIVGEIRTDGATRVDAKVEGEGNINGILLISKTCVWTGKITADKIIVEGTVEGQLIAREKIQLSSKAKVTGKIVAPEMHIAKGAILNCEVNVSQYRVPVGLLKPKSEQRPVIVDELAKRRHVIQKTA